MASVGKSNQGDKIVAKPEQIICDLSSVEELATKPTTTTQRAYVIGFCLVKSVIMAFSKSLIIENFGF